MKCVLEFGEKKMGFGRSVYQNLVKRRWGLDEVCNRIWPKKQTKTNKNKKKIFRPLSESLTRFTTTTFDCLQPRLNLRYFV